MPFEADTALTTEDARLFFGDYLGTFHSERGEVRADLFRRGEELEAHVSFPTGLDASTVADRYLASLKEFAHEHGFQGRYHLIYS